MDNGIKESINGKVKPFLKWAGGKKALLPELLKFVPKNYNRYFEPFLGSGALFFYLEPRKSYLYDLNKELINAYQQIKENVNNLIAILRGMKYNKSFYYKIRKQKSKDGLFRAARFIYLNKACWNGLYRENSKGEFNVPFGKYKNPLIYDEENLLAVSRILKKGKIEAADFEEILKYAAKGDFIYLDPPYTTSHKDNGFIEYNSKIFSLEDQNRLRNVVDELDKRKCKIIMSNADHVYIKNLYRGYKINVVKRKSLIASDKKRRKTITELIITNF